jgi:hypothetical protein
VALAMSMEQSILLGNMELNVEIDESRFSMPEPEVAPTAEAAAGGEG